MCYLIFSMDMMELIPERRERLASNTISTLRKLPKYSTNGDASSVDPPPELDPHHEVDPVKQAKVKVVRRYEQELFSCLLDADRDSVLKLAGEAEKNGLFHSKLKDTWKRLDPSVPHPLVCRYLMLGVCGRGRICHGSNFEMWLKLLAEIKGTGHVLAEMRRSYELLIQGGDIKVVGDFGRCFKETHVPALSKVLAEHSSKWDQIALSLNLPDNEIEVIRDTVSKPIMRLARVLSAWIEYTEAPTLTVLEKALGGRIVGLRAKANSLRDDLAKQGVTFSSHGLSLEVGPEKEKNPKEYCQTRTVNVTEGNIALLEVQVSSSIGTQYYRWYKKRGDNFFESISSSEEYDNEHILSVSVDDLTVEGSYKCICSDKQVMDILSEPILLTVSTPLDQYRHVLFHHYCEQREVPEDTWPPVNIDTFISLALIKSETIGRAGEYGRLTIRGDVDDIFQDKEEINYGKVFNGIGSGDRILIEGRPGSGKTTLVHKISQDWANGILTFNHVRLVFLIHLRGFLSSPNIELDDLLNCYFKNHPGLNDITKYAMKHCGLGLCFILDGLDEYVPNNKSAYIFKLIRKEVLPKSVVIVASRPAAAAEFRLRATTQIEVLGFLKEQIDDYIGKYSFAVDTKRPKLHKYLAEHPKVHDMCYLPIHTSMVCFLYDNLDSVIPQTETEIYAEFAKYTILRTLYRHDSEPGVFQSIKDLPSPQKDIFFKVCQLAFKMCLSSKQVLREVEVRDFFFVTSQKDKGSLSLITIDKIATRCGYEKLYTFLHLTFQEFLAACYISEKGQVGLLEEYQNAKHMKQVWKFYCGLIQFNEQNSHLVKTLIEKTQHGSLFQVQCCFESQQSCMCDSAIKNNALSFSDSFLNSSDFTSIAYVITNAHQQVRIIEINKCTVGIEGVNVLAGALKICTNLQQLDISYNGIDSEGAIALADALKFCTKLQELDISGNQIDISGARGLSDLLKFCVNIRVLKISSNEIGQYGACILAEGLKHCVALRTFHIAGNEIGSFGAIALADALMQCADIQEIDISKNSIWSCKSEEAAHTYLLEHSSLQKVDISNNELRGSAKALADTLKHCVSLQRVDISHNGMKPYGIHILAKGLKHCAALHTFHIGGNRIGNGGAKALADTLKHCASLQRVDISHNGMKSYGVQVLAKGLKHCGALHTFHIGGNRIRNGGAIALADALKHCTALHTFHICGNRIGNGGAIALADALKQCSNLQEINISSNKISADGAVALADALKHCASLRGFDISNNDIGVAGCEALGKSLQHCTVLQENTTDSDWLVFKPV